MNEISGFGAELETQAPARIRKQAGLIVRKTLADTERDMKAFCPVDTGNLVNSIGSDMIGSNGDLAQGEVGPTAEYADYVNGGTSRQAPNPFAWNAQSRNEPVFVSAVEAIGGVIV